MESLMRINQPERIYDLGTIRPDMGGFLLTFEDTGVIYVINEARMFYKELTSMNIQQIKEGVPTALTDEGSTLLLHKEVCEAIAPLF